MRSPDTSDVSDHGVTVQEETGDVSVNVPGVEEEPERQWGDLTTLEFMLIGSVFKEGKNSCSDPRTDHATKLPQS